MIVLLRLELYLSLWVSFSRPLSPRIPPAKETKEPVNENEARDRENRKERFLDRWLAAITS